MNLLPRDARLIFSRYTHVGLLTNQAVMGEQTLTLNQAWGIYDRWLQDPRVEFYPEPRGIDAAFRMSTKPFGGKKATKWIGDCYPLAYAQACEASLVTFDTALHAHARKQGNPAVIPG
jgi:hypothetical protein